MKTIKHSLKDKLLTTSTAVEINKLHMPKIDRVLRTLLLDHKIKPHELAMALNIPHQTISQLLLRKAIHPKISTLIPIAKFFKVTIGQLVGDEVLDFDSTTEDCTVDSPGIWNQNLYLLCTKHTMQLLAKYKILPNEELGMKLIRDIYRYSSSNNRSTIDETFANWQVSQYAAANANRKYQCTHL